MKPASQLEPVAGSPELTVVAPSLMPRFGLSQVFRLALT
jgi:hypothetical protein